MHPKGFQEQERRIAGEAAALEAAVFGDLDLVSNQEIADRLGVQKATVHQWRFRELMPAPDWILAIGPIWRWSTVEDWGRASGRLKA